MLSSEHVFVRVEDGVVTEAIVLPEFSEDKTFEDIEIHGKAFITDTLGIDGEWLLTVANSDFRKQHAGIGWFYDPIDDVFISPQPFLSWTLDENHDWQPPIPRPEDGIYFWNEEAGNWEEVSLPSPE